MKNELSRKWVWIAGAGALAVGVVIVAAPQVTRASGPLSPSASASTEPAAVAPPSASTSASALPTAAGSSIPEAASEAPKAADWKDARPIRPHRGEPPGNCRFLLLREWLRVECKNEVGVSLVAGEPKGVKTWVSGNPVGWNEATNEANTSLAVLELPLRRGQSYVATFLGVDHSGGYGPATSQEAQSVHVRWRPGDADPILIVSSPVP
jgi:hypothetical protein